MRLVQGLIRTASEDAFFRPRSSARFAASDHPQEMTRLFSGIGKSRRNVGHALVGARTAKDDPKGSIYDPLYLEREKYPGGKLPAKRTFN